MRKYTNFEARLINVTNRYADGRIFPYDLLWNPDNGTAEKALRNSDIWHVHNYLVPPLEEMRQGQKVLAQFHSIPRLGNWKALMAFADKSYTINQPLQEKEYKLPGLPNIIDPDEYRPIRRGDKIKIAFAPSTRAPIGNPCSKGYDEVIKVLNSVATKRDVDIVLIERKPYEENLWLKKQCHILIGDVVSGGWHRTALEGACFGCAVVSGYKCPQFYYSTIDTLERDLLYLIDIKTIREDFQERSRLWVLQQWHPVEKIQAYKRAYTELLNG